MADAIGLPRANTGISDAASLNNEAETQEIREPEKDGTEKVANPPKRDLKDESEEQVLFSCNICYELASEPVVTLCGHLYCWPCLYRWLQVQNQWRTCPVCKAGVDRDKVIPIYGRGGNEDPRAKTKGVEEAELPSRPSGQRHAPVVRNSLMQPNAVNVAAAQQGLGFIPTLFGLQGSPGQSGYGETLTPEQQHQAFLSRLLLMLGSFIIMCLLLF